MAALGLDEVWWLVSPGNPLKPADKEALGIAKDNLAITLLAYKNTAVKGGSLKGTFENAGFRDNDTGFGVTQSFQHGASLPSLRAPLSRKQRQSSPIPRVQSAM